MPIRITCPACSATLSVKDEYAGRSVKCPKCGGVIPPAQPAPAVPAPAAPAAPAAPPPPAPAAETKPAADEADEPAKSKPGGKIVGSPTSRSKGGDDEGEDEDDRPRRKDRDDKEDEDRPRRKKRDEDGDEEDRDRDDEDRPRRRRKRDDDDDDRPARGRKKEGGSGAGLVVAVLCGALLLCCGGGAFGIYWFVVKVKETAEKINDEMKKADTGPAIEVKAEDLAKAYKDDKAAADGKYKNKTVLVEGKLHDIMFMPGGDVYALLEGAPPLPGKVLGVLVRCVVAPGDVNKVLAASRGQTVKLKGKCSEFAGDMFVDVMDATFEGTVGPDPSSKLSANQLLAEFAKDSKATDDKYNEKPMTLTDAVVDGKDGEASILVVGASKKGGGAKIKVTLPWDTRKQIANLKPGDKIKTIKGEYAGSSGSTLYINRAWIIP